MLGVVAPEQASDRTVNDRAHAIMQLGGRAPIAVPNRRQELDLVGAGPRPAQCRGGNSGRWLALTRNEPKSSEGRAAHGWHL